MANANKRQTQILVDFEEKMSLEKAASLLESIATKLKEEGSFTLSQAGQTFKVQPSSQPTVEIKLEERSGKYKFELELEWIEGEEDKGLVIE